jgi:thiosulfate/3-mercaptopyruvate sulfurtransferase
VSHRRLATVTATAITALALAIGAVGPVAAQEPDTGVLVSADWLEENLESPNVRVIEVSVTPGVYDRGHIPGATDLVWHTDLVDTLTRDIVSQDRFEELARAAGLDDDTTVVLYGDNNNWFAAWGAWVFNLYGAQDVRLLDGGRVKWESDGRPLEVGASSVEPGSFTAASANLDLRALLPEVVSVVHGEQAAQLIDIRGPAEYNGEIFAPEGVQELSVRAGHIPGAINVPWGQNVREDGTFKDPDELRALYADLGVDGSSPIITYCRIGERASLTWFVLSQILGYDAQVYDGSWTEYGNTVGLPIVNPAGTVWGGV